MFRRRIRRALEHLGYTLSLPERLARSLIAVAGGATKIVADTVVPSGLRQSRTYEAVVGSAQRFIIEKVGEVEGVYQAEGAALPDDYVPRKIAGNVIDAAGMFAIHFSPLWMFAIVSDAAGGGRKYLDRLTEELRRDGVIGPETNVAGVTDLLDAIGKASQDSAQVFDAPPLSSADAVKLRDQLMQGYGQMVGRTTDLLPRIDQLWDQMNDLADPQKGMTRLAGLMSLDLQHAAGRVVGGAFAVGRATGGLLGETILDSYAESLRQVQQRGMAACMEEAARPYVSAFWKQYSRARQSWTERVVGWMLGLVGLSKRRRAPRGAPADTRISR